MHLGIAIEKSARFDVDIFQPIIKELVESGRINPVLVDSLNEALAMSSSAGKPGEIGQLYFMQVVSVIALTMKSQKGRPAKSVLDELLEERNEAEEREKVLKEVLAVEQEILKTGSKRDKNKILKAQEERKTLRSDAKSLFRRT